MFQFIHAADIHLDSPLHKLNSYEGAPVEAFRRATRRAFENLVQLAISEKVAFVLIAGDLYDGDWKDYNTGLYLVSQMTKLRDAGIFVFIVAGNHDAAGKITKTLRFPDNVRLFPANKPATYTLEDLQVAVHGQSFASQVVTKNLSASYPDTVPGWYNIGLLHTCATGREGHEPYAPCALQDLKNKGYDYWALGHVHQYEVLDGQPPIVFSGCTQGRHIRETGPKGCVLVTVGESHASEYAFFALDVARWATIEVDVAAAQSGYDVVDRIRRATGTLLAQNEGMPMALRIVITGETGAHTEILSDIERWINEIRATALDIGGGMVWVEKVKIRTKRPPSDQSLEHKEGAIGELLKLFDELSAETATNKALAAELADLERKLPLELKGGSDGLLFDDPAWMREMLEHVKPMLVKRLLRKGDQG